MVSLLLLIAKSPTNVLQLSSSSSTTQVDSTVPSHPPKVAQETLKPASTYTLKKRPWRRYVTPFDEILHHHYLGEGTEEKPYIIDWLSNDPEDPQNWGTFFKWANILVVAIATLAVALASSAYSGGIKSLAADFGASTELLTAGVSLFVLGFAAGPL
jgi:hypothetical protein